MSESFQQPTPTIKDWLLNANGRLILAGITSATLDSEIILSKALNVERMSLHAHPEKLVPEEVLKIADDNLNLRVKRLPIAYITGSKEFYGRNFTVTRDVLIPRPESEAIIEVLAHIMSVNHSEDKLKLVDVGTGSGCLGITAKLEFPELEVTLLDISRAALKIASLNAKDLSADVDILESDLLEAYKYQPNIIIANLPYVDINWRRSPETDYEPALALFADNSGLALIKQLIKQADAKIVNGGYIILEADPEQHSKIIELAEKHDFAPVDKIDYVIALKKL